MAKTYQSINISAPDSGNGGSVNPAFVATFVALDWTFNAGNYEIIIPETTHNSGNQPLVIVEELDGSDYRQVDLVIQNNSGEIKLIIGNDSRFDGRVLIKE